MSQQPTEQRADVYEQVTREIIEAIEQGQASWQMPWHVTGDAVFSPVNVASKRTYRGINLVCLWAAARRNGFESGTWGTYRQWKERGAQVRNGERATTVVYWKFSGREDEEEPRGEEEAAGAQKRRGRGVFATGYSVFNADQVTGYQPPKTPTLSEDERIAVAEAFFKTIPADVRHEGNAAFYSPEGDFVSLPPFRHFKRPVSYYGVLAHELTHWTGSPARLARDLSGRFGSKCYAAEELVAELGAAFVCSGLELPLSPRGDNAPYIVSWLEVLKADKRAIFTAASKAQAAVDYLLTLNQAASLEAA
ncbi:MAG: zincin-like metallopeptidase domain-containing protein [Isosphaeraceae bacterium]